MLFGVAALAKIVDKMVAVVKKFVSGKALMFINMKSNFKQGTIIYAIYWTLWGAFNWENICHADRVILTLYDI